MTKAAGEGLPLVFVVTFRGFLMDCKSALRGRWKKLANAVELRYNLNVF